MDSWVDTGSAPACLSVEFSLARGGPRRGEKYSMPDKFKIGDVVVLKSGSPPMTVMCASSIFLCWEGGIDDRVFGEKE